MTTTKFLAFLITPFFVAACLDGEEPSVPDELPLCSDLGCVEVFCTARDMCTCEATACTTVPTEEANAPSVR